MQLDTGSYVLFLLLGVAAIGVDGWFIRRSGANYLAEVYPDPGVADSVNRLISVLFIVFMLGVVALVALVDLPTGGATYDVTLRLGVTLLVMALAHGSTVWLFARMRTQQHSKRLEDETAQQR
ncbi:hypothetical protein ACWDKQ_10860 [Saccharopolyspora sp. NPDC000995]